MVGLLRPDEDSSARAGPAIRIRPRPGTSRDSSPSTPWIAAARGRCGASCRCPASSGWAWASRPPRRTSTRCSAW